MHIPTRGQSDELASGKDDVAASLVVNDGIDVYAIHGEDRDTYYRHIHAVLDSHPHLTMDDGADLVNTIHSERRDLMDTIMAGTEETTTGVIRLRAMAEQGVLGYPIIAVNDAATKHLFDNRYGTGQSTIDGILRATNRLIAGSQFVVAGYGWCGRGVAMRAAGMGARVITRSHVETMKDGAILCNAGHFNVEIDLEALAAMSISRDMIRDGLEAFTLDDGRRIHILGQGRLVNLATAEGHPSSVMDMSFANQVLCSAYLVREAARLQKKVYGVPEPIDAQIARLKLDGMGIHLDGLTEEQRQYLHSYDMGT